MRKSLMLVALFGSILLADFDSFIQNMKKKEAFFTDNNNSAVLQKELIEKYNIPAENNVTQTNEQLLDGLKEKGNNAILEHLPWITESMLNGDNRKDIEEALAAIKQNSTETKKVNTIFYLFSMSQSEYTLFNFIEEVSRLEAKSLDIKYYGVVQGMLSQEDLEKLYKPFKHYEELGNKTIIKMHPFIYKDLDLKRVPAYLFSKCPIGDFQYKKCENKYLVRGDISLQAAVEVVANEDTAYKKYLDILEGREE